MNSNIIKAEIKLTEELLSNARYLIVVNTEKLRMLNEDLQKIFDATYLQNAISVLDVSSEKVVPKYDKYLIEKNWPFMRVKNTLKYFRLGSTRNHIKGLELLAQKKHISISALISMTLQQYTGSDQITRSILGSYRSF